MEPLILAELDVVILSRIQFALTIMFHYLFPPLTIGLGIIIAYLEGMYVWRRQQIYMDAARFWTGIFGVNFAIGVATGIVMEFEFGTNWAMYSRFVGDVFRIRFGRRRNLRVFPGIWLPGDPGLWPRQSQSGISLLFRVHGRPRFDFQQHLDHHCQQLATDTGWTSDRANDSGRGTLVY